MRAESISLLVISGSRAAGVQESFLVGAFDEITDVVNIREEFFEASTQDILAIGFAHTRV